MFLAGIQIQSFNGIKPNLTTHITHATNAGELMSAGIALELVLQCCDIVDPHLLGNLVCDALLLGNTAHYGLVSRQCFHHCHRATCGMVGAGGGIVMGTDIAAGQCSHARKLNNITLLDEFYNKICYIHILNYFSFCMSFK